MNKNPYWNTLWSNRDQEFYWSGTKHGFALGIGTTLLAMWYLNTAIKIYKNRKEEIKRKQRLSPNKGSFFFFCRYN